ncbi:MAG: hypothetical protein AB7G12_05830 [Thermoanaerobaculia bacterium]
MNEVSTEAVLPERLRRVPHLAQRELEGEVVVLDLREGRLYGFNVEGGALLDSLRESRATRELGDDPAIREFVRSIVGLGLVVATDEEASRLPPPSPPVTVVPPRLLWQEEAARVTHQVSPPQMITNPQCQP